MGFHSLARASLAAMLLGAAVCAVACGGGGSSRLQGKWRGLRAEGVVPTTLAAANAFAAGMQLEVKGDAITVTTPKDKQAGHYKVVKEDKAGVVITTDKDGPGEPQTFTFVDDKTLRWTVEGGQASFFGKQLTP
jgi:hypothetical protein